MMKRRIISILIALIMALSLLPLISQAANDLTRPVGINISAMNTTDTNGNPYTGAIFSEYEYTVLNVWATWCGPCTREMPYFQQFYEEYEPLGVNVMGVLVEDGASTVTGANNMLRNNGYTYISLRIDNSLTRIYYRATQEANYIPISFLINSSGTVVSAKTGAFSSYNELENWVKTYFKVEDEETQTQAPQNTDEPLVSETPVVTQEPEETETPTPTEEPEQHSNLGVTTRTQDEIRNFFFENPALLSQAVTYSVEPKLDGDYAPGVLSDETLTSALNLLKQIRFIAGLNADIRLDENKSYYASAGTFLNYLNNDMTHYPERPNQLIDSKYDQLFEDGFIGASSSNIAWGYRNLNQGILGWMSDEDPYNIDRVGHRRWLLNPFMETTGFGATGAQYAVYVSDSSIFNDWNDVHVAWPAQQTPTRYFTYDQPWSLSFGYAVNERDVNVTLTRRSDNKTWNFSKSSSDGDFYVNCEAYGSPGCVIFRPSDLDAIKSGDVFDVTVTLSDDTTITYSVEFFTLGYPGDINGNDIIDTGDATLLLRYIVGLEDKETFDVSLADVNGDGKVNSGDAAYILAYIIGKN